MTRVLVTGASGFIGASAAVALAERGFEVHGVARRPGGSTGVTWHIADLLDLTTHAPLLEATRPGAILHLAWCTRHRVYWEAPENVDWVKATLSLIRAFESNGGHRFVGVGSCAEYDWSVAEPLSEATSPCRPSSLYGVAKFATGSLLGAYAARTSLSSAWARLFHCYGPGEDPRRLIPALILSVLDGGQARTALTVQRRDFLHSRDAGRALAALVDGAAEGPVNVASGRALSIADIAHLVAHLAGRPGSAAPGSIASAGAVEFDIEADVSRLTKEVGFQPSIDLGTGLAQVIDWWRAQRARTQP